MAEIIFSEIISRVLDTIPGSKMDVFKFQKFFRVLQVKMEIEKIEGSRKASFIYCANGYIYTKNNEYKRKINLRCHSYKKDCCGTAAVEKGIFFSKINPTLIPKIQMKSKRSKSSPK